MKNDAKISKEELNKRHVLFLDEGTECIKQIFDVLKFDEEYECNDQRMEIDEDDLF